VVRLIPAAQNNIHQRRNSFILSIFFLFLPVLLLTEIPAVAATGGRQSGIGKIDDRFKVQKIDQLESGSDLTRGTFLVAGRNLNDPNFYRTVVLLIRYGRDGASGLVINRPLNLKLSSVLPDFKELKGSKETLYLGGPVEQNKIMLLVRSATPPPDSVPVFDDVYISSSRKELQRLIKGIDKDEQFRIYAGYAGWAPGQLESECSRGDWYVIKADTGTLFDQKHSEIWQELIRRVTANWVYLNPGDQSDVDEFHSLPFRLRKTSRVNSKSSQPHSIGIFLTSH
jgi:putative transcriptional regulator